MEKKAIIALLSKNHLDFIQKLSLLSDTDFEKRPNQKWTAGQQLDHIIKSVIPVKRAFDLPKFVLKEKFGLATKPSRTYKALVEDYLQTLKCYPNYKLPKEFAPSIIKFKDRSSSLQHLNKIVKNLNKAIMASSEEELEIYCLPHPVMGKFTLREILYFTAYHVTHHEKQILKNLQHSS
jgi:hypothetical protein